MDRLKIIGAWLAKLGKYVAPIMLGYEINDIVSDIEEKQTVKYVPVMHEVIKNEQNAGFLKEVVIAAIMFFFMVIIGVKLYLKYKRNRQGGPEIELRGL